jgi:hypothetical protein
MGQTPVTTGAQVGPQIQVNNSLRAFQPMIHKTAPVEIKRIIRRVRGGSQARIVEGQDGRFYVAKFAANPQGNRTLVNEWITQSMMSYLSISTPPLRILRLPENLRTEALSFDIGDRKIPVEGEWHLGSLCPVNPQTKVIFDFLPRRLLEKVSNLNDFAKVFVVDRWLYQLDQRQAVFVRERGSSAGQIKLRAHFIDNGMAFAGSAWELREAAGQGLYMDRGVYSLVNMPKICEETVAQIEALTEEQVFLPLLGLPESWLCSDAEREKLNRLLAGLYKSTSRLRRMVTRQVESLGGGYSAGRHEEKYLATSQIDRKGMGSARHAGASANVAYRA